MQAVIGALRANLGLDSAQFERGAKRAQGSLSKTNSSFKVVQRSAARLATALAGVFASRELIRNIADFETSMSRVGAISRASATDLSNMRDIAKELGSTTEFTAAQAADGLGFLAMAGFDARESIAAIPGVLDLATASGLGLAEAADIASNVMSGFGIAATDVGSVTDVLAATASRANTNVSQLGQAMSTVAPISKALNISIQDTSAAIGVLSDAGIQGERAGTNLRGILASLAGPTRQATDALANYGLTAADVNPETKSLADIFELLQSKSITTADALQIFGREAASGALVLVNASKQLRTFSGELSNVEGAASDMAGVMRDNLGGDIKGLQSAISGLILAMGDAGLTSVIRGVTKVITEFVRGITSVVNGVSDLAQMISNNISVFLGFGQTQSATSKAIDNIVLSLADEVTAIGAVTKALPPGIELSKRAAESKLKEAQAIYAKIEAARQEARQAVLTSSEYRSLSVDVEMANDALAENRREAQRMAGGQFAPLPNSVRQNIEQTAEVLRRARLEQERLLRATEIEPEALQAAQREVKRLEDAIANASNGVVTMGESLIELGDRGEVVFDEFGNAVTKLDNAAAGSGEKVKEVTEEAEDRFASLRSSIESSMESGFMSIIDGTMKAKDAFKSMARDIIKQLYRVLVVQRLVGSLGGGGILGAVGKAFPSLVPAAANGTSYAQGGMTLVGERGPELVNMPRGSQVIDARRTASRMGNGDIVQNFSFNLSANGDESVRRIVSQAAPQIVEAAKAGVADAVRRGGSYGRAFA